MAHLRLDEFCQAQPAELSVVRHGDIVHYVLANTGFGPRSAVDLVLAEANLAEMPRTAPKGSGRRGYVFAKVAPPTRRLVFDAFVHRDVYPGGDRELIVYETALEGVANVNDRGRDLDRIQLQKSLLPLGLGLERVRNAHVPRLDALTRHVFEAMGWNCAQFRGSRVEADYPLYGSQVCLAFAPPREGLPPHPAVNPTGPRTAPAPVRRATARGSTTRDLSAGNSSGRTKSKNLDWPWAGFRWIPREFQGSNFVLGETSGAKRLLSYS